MVPCTLTHYTIMKKYKTGSRRHKARMRELTISQLRKRVSPSKNILPWNTAHAIASRVKTTKRNRERQSCKILRVKGNDWTNECGIPLPSFVNWGGAMIARGHNRNRNKQITIAGCAFPTRGGKRPSFGGNPNPKAAYYFSLHLQGNAIGTQHITSYCAIIEHFNENVRYWNHYNDHSNWSRLKSGGQLRPRNR